METRLKRTDVFFNCVWLAPLRPNAALVLYKYFYRSKEKMKHTAYKQEFTNKHNSFIHLFHSLIFNNLLRHRLHRMPSETVEQGQYMKLHRIP